MTGELYNKCQKCLCRINADDNIIKKNSLLYCSIKCLNESDVDMRTEIDIDTEKLTKVMTKLTKNEKCPGCNNVHEDYTKMWSKHNLLYCSKECADKDTCESPTCKSKRNFMSNYCNDCEEPLFQRHEPSCCNACGKVGNAYNSGMCVECLRESLNGGPIIKSCTENALSVQVGGNHYKEFAIQPMEFIHKNNLSFGQGNVVKYVTRYKFKNGLQDLKKAKHYIDLLIELEYGNGDEKK